VNASAPLVAAGKARPHARLRQRGPSLRAADPARAVLDGAAHGHEPAPLLHRRRLRGRAVRRRPRRRAADAPRAHIMRDTPSCSPPTPSTSRSA
jgi:hypothetical protein